MEIISKDFYSNCMIQAFIHKIKGWNNVSIFYLAPRYREIYMPHFMWTDGKYDYDFGIEKNLTLAIKFLFFKGHIRKYPLGRNKKYIAMEISNYFSRKAEKESINPVYS